MYEYIARDLDFGSYKDACEYIRKNGIFLGKINSNDFSHVGINYDDGKDCEAYYLRDKHVYMIIYKRSKPPYTEVPYTATHGLSVKLKEKFDISNLEIEPFEKDSNYVEFTQQSE